MDTEASPLETHRFPCDVCGADFRFSPTENQLICDYCGNTQAVGDTNPFTNSINELDFRSAIRNQLPAQEMEETRVLNCSNCAAQVEFDQTVHALVCPFCATPVVTDTGVSRHIKPRGLLPFALAESTAHDQLNDWLGNLWFAPNGLREYARKGRRMQGIYVPYWTFDADTKSQYRGERGTHYTEQRTVMRDGKRETITVVKTRWRPVSGRVARFFDDVLVLASKSLPKRFTDALEPWDLAALVPYSPEYLAGFRAEAYSLELEEGFEEARAIMDAVIRRDIRFDIGGDAQRISHVDTRIGDITFKHVLLPVWLAAYKYRGKSYRFVVNGRTGRVKGERPWSAWKITLAVTFALLVAAGIGYLMATSQ